MVLERRYRQGSHGLARRLRRQCRRGAHRHRPRRQDLNITGPDLQTFDEVAAIIREVTGCPLEHVALDDDAQYAIFDAMGIPRRPVDDQSVKGIPWNSDDMVTFGQAIREGYLAICTDDVEALTGRKARSVRQMIEENKDMLIAAANGATANA
jgi:NAD(P)H dehydrogenase (quinone)